MLKEITYEKGMKIIKNTKNIKVPLGYSIFLEIGCYLNRSQVVGIIKKYDCKIIKTYNLKIPFYLSFIPNQKFYLFEIFDIKVIGDIISELGSYIKMELMITSDGLYARKMLEDNFALFDIKNMFKKDAIGKYFFYGIDFDDPDYESGVALVGEYNFVPKEMSLYFSI